MKWQNGSLAAAALALLVNGCEQGRPGSSEDDEETPPVPVETSLPVRADIFAVYTGTAPIEAFAEADVIAKVEGEVREVLVEESDEVSKGQTMARLDGDRLRLELDESRARLAKLQRDFKRNRELQAKGLLSEGDFEKIQYELEALQAANNLAALELSYTNIRSPLDGVVSQRFIKRGNSARTGDRLFRVTSLDPLVAYMFVPEREYRRIAAGQPAVIQIDALPGERVVADVTRISPVIDAETGTFKITVEIEDKERRIKPGMFARINIVHDRRENALQVPRIAIVGDGDDSAVFVIENGLAVRQPVTTGYSQDGMVEVVSGLADGEPVVTVGQGGLKDGSRVTVIDPGPSPTPQDQAGTRETDDATTD